MFPVGSDGAHGDDTFNNDGWNHTQVFPSHPFVASNDAWLHTDPSNVEVDGGTGWSNDELEGTIDATANGLYWFWDSTWSETRS